MAKPDEFNAAVERRLQAAAERMQQARRGLSMEMDRREQYQRQFAQVSKRLLDREIGPRLHTLARFFDHADVRVEAHAQQCSCRFAHTRTFPASANLQFQFERDPDLDRATLTFLAEILPDLLEHERQSSIAIDLNNVEDDTLTTWVQERLLRFVDSYLQVQVSDRYQTFNQATDPVCGMHVSKSVALAHEYGGKTYYFCAESCREKFSATPDRFCSDGHVKPTSQRAL